MKSFFFAAAALSALIAGQAVVAEDADDKKCSAEAYFHKQEAYNTGIVFVHGKKTHDVVHGTFQAGVNYTDVQTLALKNGTIGYDKNMKAYGWGNMAEYGFLGSGSDFLLGMQMAMGSVAGLMTPEVEDAISKALHSQDTGSFADSIGFPALKANNGAALNTGMELMLNSTSKRIETAKKAAGIREKDDGGDDDDCDDDDDDDSDDSDASSNEKSSSSGFDNPPSKAVVYRPPWGTARPVYFYGECVHCHNSTGYNENGHGSLQSCSLIYRGKEYKGKPDETEHKYTCKVDFDC